MANNALLTPYRVVTTLPPAVLITEQLSNAHSTITQRKSALKYYFDIDYNYVLRKLRVVLLPFAHKCWKREEQLLLETNSDAYLPPRQDVNAPDLYIPMMAFGTYVVVCALLVAICGHFTPDVLTHTGSVALTLLLIESVALKSVLHLQNVENIMPFCDVLSYCGYKFVLLPGVVTLTFFFGHIAYWSGALIASFWAAVFTRNILRQRTPRHRYFILISCLSQFIFVFFLCYWSVLLHANE